MGAHKHPSFALTANVKESPIAPLIDRVMSHLAEKPVFCYPHDRKEPRKENLRLPARTDIKGVLFAEDHRNDPITLSMKR